MFWVESFLTWTIILAYQEYMPLICDNEDKSFMFLTCVCEGPGSIYEDHVCRQRNYDDPVGQSDQPTLPLSVLLGEDPAEQQIETGPANQTAEHLQHRHVHLWDGSIFSVKPLRYHNFV